MVSCDAGVTRNLPNLTILTSLTLCLAAISASYAFAARSGEFGLQVRLPQNLLSIISKLQISLRRLCDAFVWSSVEDVAQHFLTCHSLAYRLWLG